MASDAQLPMEPQFDMEKIVSILADNLKQDNDLMQFFAPLKNGNNKEALFKHVYQHLARYQLMPKKPYPTKCDEFSQESKTEGNRYFTMEKYKEALSSYRNAIKFATTTETISVAYANRSAVLYNLKKYHESLRDIERAIAAGCDEKIMPKLLLRKQQCEEALEPTRVAEITAEADKERLREELFRLPQNHMAGVSCASASLEVSHFESMGRGLIATEDIQPGQVLVVEDPYVTTSTMDHFDSRCDFCCAFNLAMIPCEYCKYLMYCDEECRAKSWNQGHKFECVIMTRLLYMKFPKPTLTSLRILLKAKCEHSWDEYFKIVDSVEKKTDSELKGFDSDHYAAICMFKTHPEQWVEPDTLIGCLSSALVLYMLKEYTTFFADCPDQDGNSFWRIGGLLFHHFMSVNSNCLDIEIYVKDKKKPRMMSEPVATGVYAFSSLFNHSCFPNAHYVFRGTTLNILATRLIKKGQQIFISYGPEYQYTLRSERRAMLKIYEFKCKCEACVNNYLPKNHSALFLKSDMRSLCPLNKKSIDNLLLSDENINLSLLKRVFEYVALLEEYAPCKDLVFQLRYVLSTLWLLGNYKFSYKNDLSLNIFEARFRFYLN